MARVFDSAVGVRILPPESIEAYRRDDLRYVAQTSPSRKALVVTRAQGCTVWDAEGKEYLDFTSGISVNNVGHVHPRVVEAIRVQSELLLHANVFGKYLVPVQVDLARRLADLAPGALETTFFTNSGTEAIEGALKLARKFTGRPKIVAFKGAFHGRTFGSLSVSWRDIYRKPFEPLLPGITFVPFDDLPAAEVAVDDATAAVIVEPIQGEGGVRVPSDEFLPGLRAICDRHGAMLILDEVQTGFGRTGRMFAAQHWNVVPDVLVMAKALGGGMPLGGFIARSDVMATFLDPPLSHLTTFGGHPVSCAAALASLDIIEREGLVQRAAEAGEEMMAALGGMREKTDLIADVRGKGLLIGFELVGPDITRPFVDRALELGLVLGWTIYSGTTVRIAPPLIIGDDDVRRGVAIIEQALSDVGKRS